MKLIACFFSLGVLYLAGCTSVPGSVLPSQARSLNEIRRAIYGVCDGKTRELSDNQREILSNYYPRNPKDEKFNANTSKERLYTHFWILGDRRPYEIHVQVIVERKDGAAYEEIGEDEKLSEKIAKDLEESLNRSLDKRNLIDDVRPF